MPVIGSLQTMVRKLVVVGVALLCVPGWVACQPRKMQTYTPPPATPLPPTPTQTAAAPAPTAAPMPGPEVVLGPAFTPNGLVFPPGWAMPPMPSGLPFPIPGFPVPTAMPTATAAPAPTTTAAPVPAPPTPGAASLEEKILALVNQYRAMGAMCGDKAFPPAPPMTMNAALQTAARGHSADMAAKNYFDHTSPDGTQPGQRMKGAGFFGSYSGENIAAGNDSAESTMGQWMKSPGHCSNIMDKDFKYLGVGYGQNPSAKYKHYWTQNFGG